MAILSQTSPAADFKPPTLPPSPRTITIMSDTPPTIETYRRHPPDVCAAAGLGTMTGNYHILGPSWAIFTTALEAYAPRQTLGPRPAALTAAHETYAPPSTFGLQSGIFSPRPSRRMRHGRSWGPRTAISHFDRRDVCAAADPRAQVWHFLTITVDTYAPPQTLGLMPCDPHHNRRGVCAAADSRAQV